MPIISRLRESVSAVQNFAGKVWTGVRWVSHHAIGQWDWKPPVWANWLARQTKTGARYLKADWRRTAAASFALLLLLAGAWWYKHRPKPHYTEVAITAPGLTEWDDNGRQPPRPLLLDFDEAAAPLQQVEKPVAKGIALSPAIAGTWFWVSDRQLRFTPKDDWPVGQDFKIHIAKTGLLTKTTRLEDYTLQFSSQPFVAKIASAEFYQDPRDPTLKKVVTTLEFTHPVDTASFEKAITLSLASDAAYLGLKPDSRNFTVVYDKFHMTAGIHSVPLALPRDDTKMTVTIAKGIHAQRGGNDTSEPLNTSVVIPGRGSLRFSDLQMTLVDNERYEPEQILLVKSSSPVTEKAITGKVSAWVLPVHSPKQDKDDQNPWEWTAQEVGSDTTQKSTALKLDYKPSESPGDTAHGFHFDAPVGRYVYVQVKEGVEGTGGYVSANPFVGVFQVQPYPKALTFLGQGALLSLAGDKKIGFLVRDIDRVQVGIGRVLPNQLQHLAPQMWDYAKPQAGDYIANKIVERTVAIRDYQNAPGKPSWDSIDLTPYVQTKTGSRGLFLLELTEVRKGQNQPSPGDEDGQGPCCGPYQVATDHRLILVTDLGLIVKHNLDQTRDVFVQSIHTGTPVEGAKVEVLGQNGEPVVTVATDANGHALLPVFSQDWRRERQPETILVEKGDDFSFLPLNSGGRNLDYSRFDVGGAVNAQSQDLTAYLFTDRGIYRPGETAHIGAVMRTGDWQSSLAGLPIRLEISDSRGVVVSRNEIKLSAAAFESIDWTSASDAPTGTYQVAAWLPKTKNHNQWLGSTSFRVQEFEPDRMKLRLDLSDKSGAAWLRPSEVAAYITASLLSGEPAAGRRADGEMSLSPVLPSFSRYPDHRFEAAEFRDEPYHETLAAVTTDSNGNAAFKVDLDRFAGRAYRLSMLARVYEAGGGRNVAAQNSVIVSDSPWLVGIKPDGDMSYVSRNSSRTAHWLAVNQQLDPVAVDNLTLEWVQRKYVSVLTEQDNKTYKYVSRLKEIVRDSRKINIARGGTNIPLRTAEPGDFVLVLRDSNGAEINKLSYSVAGDANISRSLERNAELEIQLNKKEYSAGDTIDVAIRAPYIGAGLITIERDKVYAQQWFKSTTTSSVQHIRLPNNFEGSGYVAVQFVRDPSSSDIFLSPLSYGIQPFSGNLSARTEGLTVTAPQQVKPGAPLDIRVKPATAARVVVIAVDEGILQVARYRNPDPIGYFFQKRMLQVDTTQILDLILPEFRKFLALAAPGGDADGGYARHLNPFQRKRKPPVAYWSGIVDVTPAGHDFRYVVPDYFNGKLRIIAIAVTPARVGVQQQSTVVKGDFLLTPNVPADVTPGDEFIVSTGVYDNTQAGKGPIHIQATTGPELTALGPATLDLDPAGKKEVTAEFRFRANGIPGSADIQFAASRGAANAKADETTSIRPSTPYRTQLTLGRMTSSNASAPLARDLYSQLRKVDASISSVPLVWGQGLTQWLGDYPYLCTEQLTSKGVAAMILASRPEFGHSADPQSIAKTISAIGGRQNEQGGLGLWASSPETAEFPTVYAVNFLLEAKEHGQHVPDDLLDRLNEWLQRFAGTPAPTLDDARNRAFAVYLLARQGIKPVAQISNVEQELSNRYPKEWPTDLAAAYLASTYQLLQRTKDADRIIANVPWSRQKNSWTGFDYYGPEVHDAQLLYLESKHFPARLNSIPPTVFDDMAKTSAGYGLNSLDAADILLALDAYAKTATPAGKFGIAAMGKDGKPTTLPLSAGVMPKASIPENIASVLFTKEGSLPAYYSLSESGFDRNAPQKPLSQGIEILHDYVNASGDTITKVRSGDEFFVRIRLRMTSNKGASVAVTDMLPGGVDPVLELQAPTDTSTSGADPAMAGRNQATISLPIGIPQKSTWRLAHVDVRDDRVVLFGYVTGEAVTFTYRARATTTGTFQTPPSFVEGMYDRGVIAQSMAGKLEITKP